MTEDRRDLQENLAGWLKRAAGGGFKAFPDLEKGRFRSALDETAGFRP